MSTTLRDALTLALTRGLTDAATIFTLGGELASGLLSGEAEVIGCLVSLARERGDGKAMAALIAFEQTLTAGQDDAVE